MVNKTTRPALLCAGLFVQANDAYDFLRKTGDGERILAEYEDNHFKAAMKKALREAAIQSVDLPLTLQELKRLRNETPRIAPRTPFSPDFEALYTPAQEGLLHSHDQEGDRARIEMGVALGMREAF